LETSQKKEGRKRAKGITSQAAVFNDAEKQWKLKRAFRAIEKEALRETGLMRMTNDKS